MNKKVLKTMIGLVVVFLVALYVIKIFFPQEFVMVIENEQFIKIGNYIDSHKWAYYLFGICTSFITYWLYFGAVCRRWLLNWKQLLAIFIVIGGSIGLSFVDSKICSAFTTGAMLCLPLLLKGDMRYVPIVFSVHLFAQNITLAIRNLPMYIANYNSVIFFALTLECYIWMVLFYLLGNFKDKEI